MGEEEKKPETEKKAEDPKPKAEDEKPKKEGGEEKKQGDAPAAETAAPPPPPPEELEMRVFMHCEGCARKVRRSLKGFDGVEEVRTDCRTHKVVVKGKKAAEDPLKVVERVQKKTGRKVELLSPLPPPKPQQKKEEEKPKVEDKKEEPVVMTVVLKVHMHCEACAQEIKERILRMKGVHSAEPNLKASLVVVKGVVDPTKLVEYIYKRASKHAMVIKAEPVEKKAELAVEKKEEEKGKDKDEKKDGDKQADECNKGKEEEKGKDEKKDADKPEKEGSGGDAKEEKELSPEELAVAEALAAAATATVAATAKIDQKRNEFYYYYPPIPRYPVEYPQHHQQVAYAPHPHMAYAPQIFSDENPNACSVM